MSQNCHTNCLSEEPCVCNFASTNPRSPMKHTDFFLFQWPLSFKRFLSNNRIHVISTSDEKEICDVLHSHTLYVLITQFPFQSFSSLVVGKILNRKDMVQKIFYINDFFKTSYDYICSQNYKNSPKLSE